MAKVLKKIQPNKETSVIKKSIPTRASYLSQAQDLSTIDEVWSSLFYGRSGTGKTTLAGTYPKKSLLLDFQDKGTGSIKDVPGIKRILISEWDQIEGIYWELSKGGHGYLTIIFDTIDGMQRTGMAKIRKDNKKDDSEALSQREWGELANLMLQWLFAYRDLPLNVVFLSQQREKNVKDDENTPETDSDQLEPEVGPNVIPSIAKSLNAAVNIIGNTFIVQKKIRDGVKTITKTSFMLRLGPHPFYITKIRKPREFIVPSSISDPSYDKIMKIIKGEKV